MKEYRRKILSPISSKSIIRHATSTKRSTKAHNRSLVISESDKEANLKILESMNRRLNYLKNPRFRKNKAVKLMSSV